MNIEGLRRTWTLLALADEFDVGNIPAFRCELRIFRERAGAPLQFANSRVAAPTVSAHVAKLHTAFKP